MTLPPSPPPNTYPYTPTPSFVPVHPRPWLPLLPHPILALKSTAYPQLPSPLRNPTFTDDFTLTTHIVPGAYPRVSPDIPLPTSPLFTGNSAERKARVKELAMEMINLQARHERGERVALGTQGESDVVWCVINRFRRKRLVRRGKEGKSLTLFLAHANGFPKETWEVALRALLTSPAGELVDEVWAWEAAQHGDSGLLNDGVLGGLFDWADNARDMAQFFLSYLPESADAELPTHLPRLSEWATRFRKESGLSRRTLVVAGHSFGGATSTLVAKEFPALFDALILIDPVIIQNTKFNPVFNTGTVTGAISRRTNWPTRYLSLFKFFHPDVLAAYVEHGTAPSAKEGGVSLKMSSMHEAVLFLNVRVAAEAWEQLRELDERIELRFVAPDKDRGEVTSNGLGGPEAFAVRAWLRPANSSNTDIKGAGHLIVQERPRELGEPLL
ncbi:hypothetical protein CONPUDRAFT_91131 [Coniophora puteana RWD-64-598 SS2]|uniref:AB hydrolase-1 domain-containing protein n=1 Tax=Coniophora puteana (strain RWD-64-598) TaxID=741705 RepID=A0A5M3MMA5_CONPW|nr:uncharacterized protein CONPUDRAFT_91131 [Coniophora puteana RWD-64-598 SS2]EIW79904.1 hypothetical protein CONPUDRAFT_91131 [Coniophora puteana RWD-64-598 SS2]